MIWEPSGAEYCWQAKDALKGIIEGLDHGNVASGIAVYVALSWIASDAKSDSFEKSIAFIASRAGLSRRTVERRLSDLVRLGFVIVTPRKLPGKKANDENHYHLVNLWRKGSRLNDATLTTAAVAVITVQEEGEERSKPSPNRISPGLVQSVKERIYNE